MKSLPGSQTFGTSIIKTDEYVLLAKSMAENGANTDEIFVNIWAIDDMLQMQKMQAIMHSQRYTKTGMMRKNSTFTDWLSTRMGVLVDDLANIK